ARLVGEDGDDVALLDPRPAPDLELGDHAAAARDDGDPLVRLGAAGDDERAAMRNDARSRHRYAERLAGRRLARGGAAFRRRGRKEMAGGDPEPGGGDEADGGKAARFHQVFSLRSGALLSLAGSPLGRLRSR